MLFLRQGEGSGRLCAARPSGVSLLHARRLRRSLPVQLTACLLFAVWRSTHVNVKGHHRDRSQDSDSLDAFVGLPGVDRRYKLGFAARPGVAPPTHPEKEAEGVLAVSVDRHEHLPEEAAASSGSSQELPPAAAVEAEAAPPAAAAAAPTVAEAPAVVQVPSATEALASAAAASSAVWLPLLVSLLVGLSIGLAGSSLLQPPPPPPPAPVVAENSVSWPAQFFSNAMNKATGSQATPPQDRVLSPAGTYDSKLARVYEDVMEKARSTGTKLKNVVQNAVVPAEKEAPRRVSPSVVKKIRDIGDILDEAQSDVYGEEWRSLELYPEVLRAYLPLMTYYAEQAFPVTDGAQKEVNAAQRESMLFEAKQFLMGTKRLQSAIEIQKVRQVEEAFAKTSLSYDRYLKAGDLYTGYDPVTSTTIFFNDVSDSQLSYTPLALQQPQIRDEVLILQGPDKGKVGRIIWLGREQQSDPNSKVITAVVKLEPNPVLGATSKSGGVREVKAYPYFWLVQTRNSSESYVLDLALATLAACVSCAVTYPLETIKARAQMGLSWIPSEGPQALLNGVELNVLREAPNAGFLMAGFNYLTRFAVSLPQVNGNDPNLKFVLMIPSGVLAMVSGAFVKLPVVDISKQVQSGVAKDTAEAIDNFYFKAPQSEVTKKLARTFMLTVIRGVPFGAFQCFIYEVLKDKTPVFLENLGVPISAEPFIWGGIAGFCTGYLTNPPDVVMQRLAVEDDSTKDKTDTPFSIQETWGDIVGATQKVIDDDGWAGFGKGAFENAVYFAPEAMVWFGCYEALKGVANSVLN